MFLAPLFAATMMRPTLKGKGTGRGKATRRRGDKQAIYKCARFIIGYHVTAASIVKAIRKQGFLVGTNRKRCRAGKGVYFFTRLIRAQLYRNSQMPGGVILTCSLRTSGKLFYAGRKNYFKAKWIGRFTDLVFGRHYPAMSQVRNGTTEEFIELVIKDPSQAKVLKVDGKQVSQRQFTVKKRRLPVGAEIREYVPCKRT